MIDIDDKVYIRNLLQKLTANSIPIFGNMNAQQMIEHLILSIRLSMGAFGEKLFVEESKAAAIKRMIIYSDRKLPVGFKVPVLPEEPMPCEYPDLQLAINALGEVLDTFESYYQQHPGQVHVHPTMGALNHSEWKTMHGKHLAHHFAQFGLL